MHIGLHVKYHFCFSKID